MKHRISLTVNGEPYNLDVDTTRSLLDVLREELGLTGTKKGCNMGDCGACTVIMNGQAVNSCLVLAVEADGAIIETIEGLAASGSELHRLQDAFIRHGAIQCGFCTPGMIMTAKALLDSNPHATEDQIKNAIAGNICRCTGYEKIVGAIHSLSRILPKSV